MDKRNKGLTRERIIEAALDAFNNLDFREATMRDIAKRSKISLGSIYKYFHSKDELAKTIATEKIRHILTGLEEHFIGMRGTLNKLRKMTWYYLSFYENNPGVAWILFISGSTKSWHESPEVWITIRQTGQQLSRILKQGQEDGELRQDIDFRLAERMYFGTLHNLVELWLVHNRSYSITAWADSYTDMFFDAIRAYDQQGALFTCPYAEVHKRLNTTNQNQESQHKNS